MREVEVKAKLVDKDNVLAKLHELGVVLGTEIHQIDRIYVPKGKLVPVDHYVNVLRIREQNGKYWFTLKYSVTNRLDKVEREMEIAQPEVLEQIIQDLGFYEIARVEKRRRKGRLRDLEICVDDVTDLGAFVEVEKLVEDPDMEEVLSELIKCLESLGVKEEHRVHLGYDVLLYQKNKSVIARSA